MANFDYNWILTRRYNIRNSAYYNSNLCGVYCKFNGMQYFDNDCVVPDFKLRFVQKFDFKNLCSECLFYLSENLMLQIYSNGFEEVANIRALEKCSDSVFKGYKYIENLWYQQTAADKHNIFINGPFYTAFKSTTEMIIKKFSFFKPPINDYCCESFYATFMPSFYYCASHRYYAKIPSHQDRKLCTKFIDQPMNILGTVLNNRKNK